MVWLIYQTLLYYENQYCALQIFLFSFCDFSCFCIIDLSMYDISIQTVQISNINFFCVNLVNVNLIFLMHLHNCHIYMSRMLEKDALSALFYDWLNLSLFLEGDFRVTLSAGCQEFILWLTNMLDPYRGSILGWTNFFMCYRGCSDYWLNSQCFINPCHGVEVICMFILGAVLQIT